MATSTNRTALTASSPRRLVAAGVVRLADRRAAEVDAAYAESKAIADERAALVEEFVAARQTRVWMEELRVLAKAKRFDDAHPSRDSLYEELHALEMYGEQYPEAA